MVDTLSLKQARKIVLLSQALPKSISHKSAEKATIAAINQLGYIQIDTISRIERAHHHTLWNRVSGYKPDILDSLQQQRKVFEYWAHAAAYLPIEDFRYCRIKMRHITEHEKPWHPQANKIKAEVLARIKAEGPLQSKNFEDKSHKNGPWWDWKPAKSALELLFLQGELMIERRIGFQKVFNLTERVLPNHIDTTLPTQAEYAQYLIKRYLQANGLGSESEFSYLRQGMQRAIRQELLHMLEAGEIIKLRLGESDYYADKEALQLLNKNLPKADVKILSPFDNLVIQRKRLKNLFDYDYQLECYLKPQDRKFGYFCLPILWQGEFVGRMDAKADRQNRTLIIYNLFTEKRFNKSDTFVLSLISALNSFSHFNQCQRWEIQQCNDRKIAEMICAHHAHYQRND
ncbi:YcaQ family DNA glycosylase [Budviciaceae bacterium BWR-B9]|uniref:YcaQ family DNA glycosylase n=1 Tax=Limnobaculum allomyrinae TaxID=2791986 RepID=A0ABS1INX2_9GAMM|nr:MULTISPECIES: crosslink repair DNA glycosylase YcaQ family protein [Limnobaculum]MBK5143417.1 YcaQ family DNA glycosylase [Limnobaculum allomyrinae]MBV7691305.1 winged helix DNA-binding domain-containing protein [Limnobaculum sp. M2-1]